MADNPLPKIREGTGLHGVGSVIMRDLNTALASDVAQRASAKLVMSGPKSQPVLGGPKQIRPLPPGLANGPKAPTH